MLVYSRTPFLKVHSLPLLPLCVRDKCGVGRFWCKWPFSQPRRLSLPATHSHLLPLLFSQADCFLLARSLPSVLAHTLSQRYVSSTFIRPFIYLFFCLFHISNPPPPFRIFSKPDVWLDELGITVRHYNELILHILST